MINLLPPKQKRNLQAAKTNRILLRYNIGLVIATLCIIAGFGLIYTILRIGQGGAENTIADNNSRVANYNNIKQDAATFSKNLTTAKQIFASETNYTGLLIAIAQSLPSGTSLQSLSLDPSTLGKSTSLTANVTSPSKALALKDSLAKNSKVFSNVYLQSITKSEGATGPYGYTAEVNVTIDQGALTQ